MEKNEIEGLVILIEITLYIQGLEENLNESSYEAEGPSLLAFILCEFEWLRESWNLEAETSVSLWDTECSFVGIKAEYFTPDETEKGIRESLKEESFFVTRLKVKLTS